MISLFCLETNDHGKYTNPTLIFFISKLQGDDLLLFCCYVFLLFVYFFLFYLLNVTIKWKINVRLEEKWVLENSFTNSCSFANILVTTDSNC